MLLTVYSSAHAFLGRAQPALEQDEAANNVMLGVALRLASGHPYSDHPPYFATVDDGDKIRAAAVMTPPHNLVVYAGEGSPSGSPPQGGEGRGEGEEGLDDALRLIADDLRQRELRLPGVLGAPVVAETFAEIWSGLVGVDWYDGIHQRIYTLTQVVYWPATPGHCRLATEADIPLLAEWFAAFEIEAEHHETSDLAAARRAAEWRVAGGQMVVWEDRGQTVSMAGWGRPMPRGVVVNAVYTPPDLRGRGYATACVAHLSQTMLDRGYTFCVLHTDLDNPTSNSIYMRIGYRPIGDFNEIKFG